MRSTYAQRTYFAAPALFSIPHQLPNAVGAPSAQIRRRLHGRSQLARCDDRERKIAQPFAANAPQTILMSMNLHIAILALAVGLVGPIGVHAADPIPVDSEKPLQVIVHDNVAPRMRDGWTSQRTELERYREFETAMEEALKAAGYSGRVKVERFAANIAPADQRLNIYIYRWQAGLESFGPAFTAEFTMEAVLEVGGSEFELGSFAARESHVAMGGPHSEDFRPVARRAIDQMIEFYRNAIAQSRRAP